MGGTARKAIVISLGLIGLYLVLDHATGFSKDFRATGSVGRSLTRALQGR